MPERRATPNAAAVPPSHRERTRHDTLPSFGMAVAMHALLFLSISYVVRWKTTDPAPVVAELWTSAPTPVEVPVPAPPPPPPPPPPKVEPQPEPPPPPKPDIITQEQKKPPPKKEEPKKVEEKKPPPKKQEPKKDLIADLMKKQEAQSRAERDALREAENERIRQQMAQDKSVVGTPQPGTSGGRDDAYIARLTALIKSRIVYAVPEGTPQSVYAEVQVDLLPTGEVAGIRFLRQSGLPEYDAAVERAIRRTDPFPRKPDGTIDRTIVIRFRPVEQPQ